MYVDQYWSHSYIPSLVRADGYLIDIGFYGGGFSSHLSPRCKGILAFEPDPRWQRAPSSLRNVTVVPKAIGATAGMRKLFLNDAQCSSFHHGEPSARSIEVQAITLEDALSFLPDSRIDLVKMDIEGEELSVLADVKPATLERVVQLAVEFHDFLDPDAVPKIRKVLARMAALHFVAFKFSLNNYGDVLFLNRNLVEIGSHERLWILMRYKYARGVARWIGRRFRSE